MLSDGGSASGKRFSSSQVQLSGGLAATELTSCAQGLVSNALKKMQVQTVKDWVFSLLLFFVFFCLFVCFGFPRKITDSRKIDERFLELHSVSDFREEVCHKFSSVSGDFDVQNTFF